MKVNIGPYTNWIGPYQIAEKLMFWADKHNDDRVYKLGDFLAHGFYKPDPDDRRLFRDQPKTLLYKFCEWIHSKKERKIEIKIDRYDSWSAAHTLSMIALPLLKQLAEEKHGSPYTDDDDVPAGMGLRSTEAPPKENEWDTDENIHRRWAWILKEIIWAHEQIVNDDWQSQFYAGRIVFDSIPSKDHPGMSELVKSDEDTSSADYEGMKKYQERINNGMRLFGKYYENLWD